MIEALRSWVAWFRCAFGLHDWCVWGDWRDGAIFAYEGKRYWGFTHNCDFDFAGHVRVECDRCGTRGYGRFAKRIGRDDWLNRVDQPREWWIMGPHGSVVAGAPTHEEAERELG